MLANHFLTIVHAPFVQIPYHNLRLSLGKHGGLYGLQEGWEIILQPRSLHCDLLPVVSPDRHIFTLLNVFRTNIQSDWDPLQFPMIILPAWTVVVPKIRLDPDPRRQVLAQAAWDNDHLETGHSGWEDQAIVVTVHHHHYPDGSGGNSPAVLVNKLLFPSLWILK